MNDTLRQWLLHTGFYVFGVVAGATVMIYVYEQPKAKPVVTVEQDGAKQGAREVTPEATAQQARDAAPPLAAIASTSSETVRILERIVSMERDLESFKLNAQERHGAYEIRQEQRNKELAFAARKLAGVKRTWDLKMGEGGR
jgi:hypothetical protein